MIGATSASVSFLGTLNIYKDAICIYEEYWNYLLGFPLY